MIIYSQGNEGPHEVEWDPYTGAVRVHPDGEWMRPNHDSSTVENPFV